MAKTNCGTVAFGYLGIDLFIDEINVAVTRCSNAQIQQGLGFDLMNGGRPRGFFLFIGVDFGVDERLETNAKA